MGIRGLIDRARTYDEYERLMDEASDAWVRVQEGGFVSEEDAEKAALFEHEVFELSKQGPMIHLAVQARLFSNEVLVP